METIQHIAFEDEWIEARESGEYIWSTRDLTIEDAGFMHASFPAQTLGVAQRFYSDVDAALVLLTIDADTLGAHGLELRVEPGLPDDLDSEKFPHVYGGNLPIELVTNVEPYTVPGS